MGGHPGFYLSLFTFPDFFIKAGYIAGQECCRSMKTPRGVRVPTEFSLRQCYVDAAGSAATIVFDLPVEAAVTLKIYNDSGRELAVLADGEHFQAGTHHLPYRGDGDFFYRIIAQAGVIRFKAVKRAIVR